MEIGSAVPENEPALGGGLLRPHSILDPIHGLLRFTDEEFAVLNHRLFQRLRRIKQNGLLYLVFPSATHHRLEHSLGAMHVADAMLDQIAVNSVVAARKKAIADFLSDRTEVAINYASLPRARATWIRRLTRLAALVHDLGHGPLSHAFDSFALQREDLRRLLASGALPELGLIADELAEWHREGTPGSVDYDLTPHEVMSCILFSVVWRDIAGENAEEQLPHMVAAAVLGSDAIVAKLQDAGARQWIPFIHDLIASAPADADRMDYLERDSMSLGVTYGLFDRNRVLKSLLCARRSAPNGPVYRLAVKLSGVPALENLVQARFQLWVQIYLHKTNHAITLMLKAIGLSAREAGFSLFDLEGRSANEALRFIVDRYLDLGDDTFLRLLRGLDCKTPNVPPEVSGLAEALEGRVLWKRLFEGSPTAAHLVADRLAAEQSDAAIANGVFSNVAKPKATKDLDDGARVVERGPDGIYAITSGDAWYHSSILISALKKAEGNIGRVYARDAALAESGVLKNRARQLGLAIAEKMKHEPV